MANKEGLAQMAHLMRRAGFGATREELDRYVAMGYEATVEELIDPPQDMPAGNMALLLRYMPGCLLPGGVPQPGQYNWMFNMITTKRPLEEKVALFWHQVFATGNSKIDNCDQMLEQLVMFRKFGMGNYREMLVELSKNPAMLYWLDNNENHRDAVNENWGRELLELFSMGVSNYTEVDVREASRAFTGWTIAAKLPRQPFGRFPWAFEYLAEDHDDGEKTFLGHTGDLNGEDIIDIIAKEPATARFICRHLYNFFVADEVQVPAWTIQDARDEDALEMMINAFEESGYEIKAVLRTMFNSDFFKNARYSKIKSPAEVVASTLKMVGSYQTPEPTIPDIGPESTYMGQSLLDPPSVEGWYTGQEWINSGSLLARINFVADRVANTSLPGISAIIGHIKSDGVNSPEELVEASLEHMGFLEVGDETMSQLLDHAKAEGNMNWNDEAAAGTRVGEMLALVGATTEYQFG
ncbi:MAG: DUF1800 domain-containing protein [Chloroflexota bacterium]|jgi:hypothetical protein|nr:hypothetical protein [Dehalococcoidia bacterium]MED5568698.1 DUF1800 domain-containing protein [Chloroflexota bacterium]MEE3005595.1 DUF1800 domain-containing protein [Chloroflexota bacterium]MEE3141264.1 DUF1800 domain-containing protein [Chloroflexota bacterium]HAJ01253.1 hypothetical protein [Dehalococcoidia bacterium]|tara:strand:+ start:159 stop:1559 length:1401 start_codon:yes stop_codon:yes gene_type:complete